MVIIKPIRTGDAIYNTAEHLMQTAFPAEERRDTAEQRWYTDHKENFHYNTLWDKESFVGIITYWDFQSFYYIEHFAIHPELRNKGYGQAAIEAIKSQLGHPIVLEVEEPTDNNSIRRIKFYERQGFILHQVPYLQPPYRPADKWFPLKLMTFGEIDMEQSYQDIKEKIYKEVYNQP